MFSQFVQVRRGVQSLLCTSIFRNGFNTFDVTATAIQIDRPPARARSVVADAPQEGPHKQVVVFPDMIPSNSRSASAEH